MAESKRSGYAAWACAPVLGCLGCLGLILVALITFMAYVGVEIDSGDPDGFSSDSPAPFDDGPIGITPAIPEASRR